MGHDISGYNKAGKEIAYARFSMWNTNAIILYHLLDANNFYAGVSGSGKSSNFSIQQMEKALDSFHQQFGNKEFNHFDLKQIQDFIFNCFITAEKEGSVKVFFG